MNGRHERYRGCGVVIAILAGCSGPAPEAPARDGASDLGVAETSAVTDGDLTSDVVDAGGPTDRDHDAGAPDVTAPIDARVAADASDASAVIDGGAAVDDARAATGGGSDAAPADVVAPTAEFLAIYEQILRPRCATSSCHVVGSATTRLVMSDAASSYARLVNVRDECGSLTGSRIRVVPFDPSMSAILLFNRDGLCGRRHNAFIPESYGAAQREADEASFRAWIMAGAK